MAGGNGPLVAKLFIGAREDLTKWETGGGEVMITERSCLVWVVEYHEPPVISGKLLVCAGYECQVGIDAPRCREISVHLRLQR